MENNKIFDQIVVTGWNNGDTKSKIMVDLNKAGCPTTEIVKILAKYDITTEEGKKICYGHVRSVLDTNGCEPINVRDNTNKKDAAIKLAKEGVAFDKIVAQTGINKDYLKTVLRKEGFSVKTKKSVGTRTKINLQ